MIITIDGPAASGKGTVAKGVAGRLGFAYLDTGAMYRAVALAARRGGWRCDDAEHVAALLPAIHIEMPPERVLLNGEDVTEAIRSPEMSQGASQVAAIAAVRAFLVPQQRRIALGRDIVCEGRDQGTVVFPDAPIKFFFTAELGVRAERRYRELVAKGVQTTLEREYAEIAERDRRDTERADGPLRQPPDAIVVDTSHLTTDEVIDRLEGEIRKCLRPNLTGRLFYDFVYWSSYTVFGFGFSYRRRGWANMPSQGPVLVVSNHQSMFDPLLIGLASRRYLSFLARKNLFDQPVLAPAIRKLNAIPIDRGMGKDGIQAVIESLGKGRAVLVFPEGERTSTGAMMPLKPGISLLVKRVSCPIVPVGIAGAYAAWSRHAKVPTLSPLFLQPRASTIAVSVGPPIEPERYKGMDREAMLADLYRAIAAQFEEAEQLRRKP